MFTFILGSLRESIVEARGCSRKSSNVYPVGASSKLPTVFLREGNCFLRECNRIVVSFSFGLK